MDPSLLEAMPRFGRIP